MPARRRRSRSFKSPRSRRLTRRTPKFGRRRSLVGRGRTPRRFGFRGGGGNHKRLSKQSIKTFFPDIALTKMKGHHIWTGIDCNDLSTALAFGQGVSDNTFTIKMNANPNGGDFYYQPGTSTGSNDTLLPATTYSGRYSVYRPMGCKVTVTVFTQDNGEVAPENSVSNIQVATPFMLYGFPFVAATDPSTLPTPPVANSWTGTPTNGFTANTVPQLKYGFRKISSGLGGKSMIKYSTYWDFAKILGWTKSQYLSSPYVTCNPDDNDTNPDQAVMLCLALADYTPAVQRQCTVDIKITQYGRWEGQELLYQ